MRDSAELHRALELTREELSEWRIRCYSESDDLVAEMPVVRFTEDRRTRLLIAEASPVQAQGFVRVSSVQLVNEFGNVVSEQACAGAIPVTEGDKVEMTWSIRRVVREVHGEDDDEPLKPWESDGEGWKNG